MDAEVSGVIAMDFLDAYPLEPVRRAPPFVLPWPVPGNPGGLKPFSEAAEWRRFVHSLALRNGIPLIVAAKFRRAQKLFYLGWIDVDLIKASELVALTALELALVDRYGKKSFAQLLKHMQERDGATDATIPIARKYGGTIEGMLTGATHPCLSEIRNSLAHGDPFDGLPYAGLLELVRDLIEHAYRSMPA